MHPARRNILIRWIGYGVVVLATCGWLYMEMDKPVPRPAASDVVERLSPKEIEMPSEEITQSLERAMEVFRGERASYGGVDDIEPELIVLEEQEAEEEQRKVLTTVSSVVLGQKERYAVIGGVAYREGDLLPDGRRIGKISKDGVLLRLGAVEETLPWLPPLRVHINKVVPEPATRAATGEGAEAAEGGQQAGAAAPEGGVDLENLPGDMTPDQALDVLQQVGQQ